MEFTYAKAGKRSADAISWAVYAESRRIGMVQVDGAGVTASPLHTPWKKMTATTLEEAAQLLWEQEAIYQPGRKPNWEDNGGIGKMRSGSIHHPLPNWVKQARQRPL